VDDGILDDGNLSGVSGDAPCAAPLVQLCDDSCPALANAAQADAGGVGSALPNGAGDACGCGTRATTAA
jgi:hypothetical protein